MQLLRRNNQGALLASATRVRLSDRAMVRKAVRPATEKQADAWAYFDATPELGFVGLYVGNALSKVVYRAMAIDPDDATGASVIELEDAGLSPQLVADARAEMGRLRSEYGGQAAINRQLAMNLEIAAEGWIVGRGARDEEGVEGERGYRAASPERWEVKSVLEVIQREKRLPDGTLSRVAVKANRDDKEPEPIHPDIDTLIRFWQPHPAWSNEVHTALFSVLDECEALAILSRQVRAEGRSRLPSGLLLLPNEVTWEVVGAPTEDGTGETAQAGSLVEALAQAMAAPIEDEASPAGLAPVILRAQAELLKEVRRVDLSRSSEDIDAKIETRVKRIARGVMLPPEVTLGHQETTYANAFQVDEDTYEDFLQPRVLLQQDILTVAFLRPNLTDPDRPGGGHDLEQVAKIVVVGDPSNLIATPNPVDNVDEGHARRLVKNETWRRLKGFSEDDAPEPLELLIRTGIERGILTADLSYALLKLLDPTLEVVPIDQGDTPTEPTEEAAATAAALMAALGPDPTEADVMGVLLSVLEPRRYPDAIPALALAAASSSGAGRDLLDIDRQLRDRLLVASDRALTRAVEVAGSRLRNSVPGARAITAGLPALGAGRALVDALGRDVIVAAAGDDLFDGAFDELRDQFMSWGAGAQSEAIDLAHRVSSGFTTVERAALQLRQADDLVEAWAWMEDTLRSLATAELFDPAVDLPELGELDEVLRVPAGVIRQTMARAGGALAAGAETGMGSDAWLALVDTGNRPAGGIGTGELIRSALLEHGVAVEGYRWIYGIAPRRTFHPHARLNGVQFENFDDPQLANMTGWPAVAFYMPGDHQGCLCDVEPVLLVGSDPDALPPAPTSIG